MMHATELHHDYQKAQSLLDAGELRQAADLCKAMLNAHPDFAYGYHLMSALFRATGTFDRAAVFSQMAIQRQPDIAAFHLQLGQIFFAISDWESAADAFEKAHKLAPGDPFPLLLKGDAYTLGSQFDQAMAAFRRARAIKNISEIDEHEGLCLLKKGEVATAETLFERVIERRPDYFWGYIHKGKLLLERNMLSEAEAYFAKALKYNPAAYEALHNMALIYELRGESKLSIHYITQALHAHPKKWKSHLLLGQMLLRQQLYELAEQTLQQAYTLKPDDPQVVQMLIAALLRQQKQAQALQQVEDILKIQPDNAMMRHFRAMLRGEKVDSSPSEYIVDLFNSCAEQFDRELQQMLFYNAPATLAEAVCALPDMQGKMLVSLLDLGCGTGLVGEAFQAFTDMRVGVDLSENMLGKARNKQLYNELHTEDIVDFMLAQERSFDLVVAADVLIYVGNLVPFFKAARNVLAAQGLLVFSIERDTQSDSFSLQVNGRFMHAPHYVLQVAYEEGYTLVQQSDMVLRMENHLPVQGALFIFKKSPMH